MLINDPKEATKELEGVNAGTFACVAILILLLLITIIGSCFDEKPKGYQKVLNWFSIRKNAHAILYSENKSDKNLDVLNGVRVLSIGWVVLGHSLFMHLFAPMLNT